MAILLLVCVMLWAAFTARAETADGERAVGALLYEEEKTGEARLCVWSPQTGEVARYDQLMQSERVTADGEYLLVFCLEPSTYSPVLALVDLTSGEITIAAENAPRGDALLLDIGKNTAYVADAAALYEITRDEKTSRTRRFALPFGSQAIGLAGGALYGYNGESGQAEAAALSEQAAGALTIAGYQTELLQNDPALQQAASLLREARGAEVSFRLYGSSDDLILALMSDLDQIDLLMLNNFNLANYLRADVLIDLDEAPQIQALQASGQYAGWLFELGRDEGALHMLPVGGVSPTLWTVDGALLSELGEEKPEADWSWADFLRLAEKCAQHGLSAMEEDHSGAYFTTPGVSNYLTGYVEPVAQTADFDTPAFREMCEVWAQCVQKGYVCGAQEHRKQLFAVAEPTLASLTEEELDSLVYPPRAGEERVVDVECALLVFADYDWYAQEFEGLLSQKQFDFYQETLSMSALRDTLIPVRHAVNECLTRYFTQEASFDEALREIEQRVGMMLFE